MHRLVVDHKGVTMSDGQHLPPGTRIGIPVYAIHHDNSVYHDAATFDAFRFSRERESISGTKGRTEIPIDEEDSSDGGVGKGKSLDAVLKSRNLATVTTSETFL